MRELFSVDARRATLTCFAVSDATPTVGRDGARGPHFSVVSGAPTTVRLSREGELPRFYEQADYRLVVRSKSGLGSRVSLKHRDPDLVRSIISPDESSPEVIAGSINFRNQVGRSRFDITVDGRVEFTLEVEVYPSKLDYREDYEQLVAEVQWYSHALAFDYLKATYHTAQRREGPPTALEWALQLRSVVDDLERGLWQIGRHPIRGLRRELHTVRAERVRRADSSVRRALRIGGGAGPLIELHDGYRMRSSIPTARAEPTLDTPEHRWLADKVRRAHRRVSEILHHEESRLRSGQKHAVALKELRAIASRLEKLLGAEPLAGVSTLPPAGFGSLQLLGSPGYREAYEALIALQLGLRLDGDAAEIALKDISTLYEYWCFLAVLDIVSQRCGASFDARQLVDSGSNGLRVLLRKGITQSVTLALDARRRIRLEYNPQYNNYVLLSQQPDIVIAVEELGRPTVRIVLDAKYRVDASPENTSTLGVPGPPADALNVLHRYRDAILTFEPAPDEASRMSRSVVYAAALYPSAVDKAEFSKSHLARQLRTVGVGAIPFLPSNRNLLEDWIDELLGLDAWSLGRVAQSSGIEPWVWRAATESVLVGVLSAADTHAHLRWVRESKSYYLPELDLKHRRHLNAKYIAIYTPAPLRNDRVGAVEWLGVIQSSEVVARSQINTPWPSRDPLQTMRHYRVAEWVQLARPVLNSEGDRFSASRWTTKLAIERASTVSQLSLESPLEWALFDAMQSARVAFAVRAGEVRELSTQPTRGKARFVLSDGRVVSYAGMSGFEIARGGGAVYCKNVEATMAQLQMA